MRFMLTLLACLIALATAAPALAGNGQSVSESIAAVQANSTGVDPAASVAAPVGVSAPICIASRCTTGQSSGPAGSSASTTVGGQSRPAGQKVSHSIGAVQVGSTTVGPAVSAAAPVDASAPVCVASGCSASQAVAQSGSDGASTTGGGQSQTVATQSSQTPNPTAGTHGNAAAGAPQQGVAKRSAVKGRRNGLFTPVAGPHEGQSPAAGAESRRGRSANHAKGCAFSGVSAKVNGRPTAAGLVPSGGWSLTLLLAIACGLLGFSSLSQWLRSEMRWRKG